MKAIMKVAPGVGNVEANVLLTEERRPGPI